MIGILSMRSRIAKIIDLDRRFVFRINWAYVLVAVLFWTYGYQAAINTNSLVFQLGFAIYLIGAISYLLSIGERVNGDFVSELQIHSKDLLVLILMLALWVLYSFSALNQPIVGDQLYYGMSAKRHEIVAVLKLSPAWADKFILKDVVHVANIVSLVLVFAIARMMKRHAPMLSTWQKIGLISVVVLTFRFFVIQAGGGGSPFGPLQLFPLWVTTSIFGLSDFALRFAQTPALILTAFWIYLLLTRRMGRVNSVFVAAALCAIPLLIHVSTIVEASVWTTATWTIFLVSIFSLHQDRKLEFWIAISSILSIAVVLRSPSFLAFAFFIPIFLVMNWTFIKKNKKLIGYALSPFLLGLPFIVSNLLTGTPATYSADSLEAVHIPNAHSLLHRLYYAFSHGIVLNTALSTVGALWLAFIFGVFVPQKNERHYILSRVIVSLFLMAAIAMFFSIRPSLWITDRYKAEYLIPFVILGAYLLFCKMSEHPLTKKLVPVFACAMVFVGGWGGINYKTVKPIGVSQERFMRETESVYDYTSALAAAKAAGFASHTLLVGNTNAEFPFILAGFSIADVKNAKALTRLALQAKDDWTSVDPELVNSALEVQLVLISDTADKQLRAKFQKLGWMDWNQFPSKDGAVIYALVRRQLGMKTA